MKEIVVFFLYGFLYIIWAYHTPEQRTLYQVECMNETNATIDDYEAIFYNNTDPTNRQQTCLFACYLKKMNMMTDKNVIKKDTFRYNFIPELEDDIYYEAHLTYVQFMETCVDDLKSSEDACKIAEMFLLCMNRLASDYDNQFEVNVTTMKTK